MNPARIVVLVHHKEVAFDAMPYLIRPLIKEWEDIGLAVRVVRGVRRSVSADLLIPHLDMTVTPKKYRDFLLQYPNVINKNVLDISKTGISANLVGRNDDYVGPVIVKTDLNYGGFPERELSSIERLKQRISLKSNRKIAPEPQAKAAASISWKRVRHMNSLTYPVFSSLDEVPKEVFGNKALVVEKFIPEFDAGAYCIRYYYFFGDAEMSILIRSKDKVVKYKNSFEFEETPIPPGMRAIRQKLGFDYGKLDYVLRDGKPVLIDANRTPAMTAYHFKDLRQNLAHRLAKGIRSRLAV